MFRAQGNTPDGPCDYQMLHLMCKILKDPSVLHSKKQIITNYGIIVIIK